MYNIFNNDFYDTKPAPKWAFTVEFFLSEKLDQVDPGKSDFFEYEKEDDAPPKWLQNVVNKLQKESGNTKAAWMDKLQKSVCKVPIQHPEHQNAIQMFFPGYQYTVPGRYAQSGSLTMTFNDNVSRDIRCILEQLMHFDGLRYRRDPGDNSSFPTLPSMFRFDMLVRIYDVEKVNQYDPTDGLDEVAEHGTVVSFFYESCYVSKIGNEKNTYESSDKVRTIDATINYQRMVPLQGDRQL
jgi:hypothetical protein